MAPEAWSAERSERTDVWSAGVILYEMLAGHKPFAQTERMSLMQAVLNAEPAPLPDDIPEGLRRVVLRALQKGPAQRYKSASEMLAELHVDAVLVPTETPITPCQYESIEVNRVSDVFIVRPVREYEHADGVDLFRKELLSLVNREDCRRVIVRLDPIRYWASSMYVPLLSALRQLRAHGGRLRLCHINPVVLELF